MVNKIPALPSRIPLALLAIPMLVAIGVSGYLTYASVTASEIAGCGGGQLFDCGHVLYSKWSKFAGLPVSGLALMTYIVMIGAAIVTGADRFSSGTRQTAWSVVIACAMMASFAAIYFIFLQVAVLKHLCMWCLIAHSCGLIIAAAILAFDRISMPKLTTTSSIAAASLAVLITVQINSPEAKKFKIETYQPELTKTGATGFETIANDISTPNTSEVDLFAPPVEDFFAPPTEDEIFEPPTGDDDQASLTTGMSSGRINERSNIVWTVASLALPNFNSIGPMAILTWQTEKSSSEDTRVVSFSGTKLNVAQWPLAGSPDAEHIFVTMFDYTCPHCRTTHGAIRRAEEKLDGEVAVVSLPVPMNTGCNSTVPKNDPVILNRVSCLVWRSAYGG